MWATGLCALLGTLVALQGSCWAAPASSLALAQDWPDRYLDRELAVELYGMLQNYLMEGMPVAVARPPGSKRNSEIINSLLALPKSMADVGRR